MAAGAAPCGVCMQRSTGVSFDALCCGQNSHKMLPFDAGGTDLEQQKEQPSEKDQATEDVPASEYARLQWFLVAWLVGDCALLTWSNVPTFRHDVYNAEALIFPITISLCMLYFFATIDSSAVGKRAANCWALYWVYLAVSTAVSHWARGETFLRGLTYLLYFAFIAAAYGWLMNVLRSELRALGSLDTTRITARLYEIMGFQAAMAVIGATQGIGAKAFVRITATVCFSMSLIFAWLFSVAIFEVAGVDSHAAMTKLRLSPLEAVALTCTGLLVLFGGASYMLSEQGRPKRNLVFLFGDASIASMTLAYFCTARIVWVARRRRLAKVATSLS